jgi:hypothetical protein
MIEDVVIELDGRQYRWSCDLTVASNDDCWSWCDEQTFMKPPGALIERLNREFLNNHANDVVFDLDDDELQRFYKITKSMGASDDDFGQDELESMLELAEPERLQEVRFRVLPPPAHTPINSPTLRDWIFSSPGRTTPPSSVFYFGSSPYEAGDLCKFLSTRGVQALEYASSWNLMATFIDFLSRSGKPTAPISNYFVLGREGWTTEQLDELIERYRGRQLYLYSQEMFLTYLMTGADPFAASDDVLAAFRAGHPALEEVSQGWPGWVSTFVPFGERSSSSRRSGNLGGMEPESPLKAMGYRVGKQGLPAAQRQTLLHAAFSGPIPKVGGADYMSEWGDPGTAKRLKKIATAIASFCRNMKHRENQSVQAIEDWEDDLRWLKENCYRGRFTFSWPSVFVD